MTRLNWDREARQARVRKNGAMSVFSDAIACDWSSGRFGQNQDPAEVTSTYRLRSGSETLKGRVTAAPSLNVQAVRSSFELQRLLRLTGNAPWAGAGESVARVTPAEVQHVMDKLVAVVRIEKMARAYAHVYDHYAGAGAAGHLGLHHPRLAPHSVQPAA